MLSTNMNSNLFNVFVPYQTPAVLGFSEQKLKQQELTHIIVETGKFEV